MVRGKMRQRQRWFWQRTCVNRCMVGHTDFIVFPSITEHRTTWTALIGGRRPLDAHDPELQHWPHIRTGTNFIALPAYRHKKSVVVHQAHATRRLQHDVWVFRLTRLPPSSQPRQDACRQGNKVTNFFPPVFATVPARWLLTPQFIAFL